MRYTAYKCDQCMHHFMGEPPITEICMGRTRTFCTRKCANELYDTLRDSTVPDKEEE